MSRRASPSAVGAFVLGGIVVAVAGVLVLGRGTLFTETSRSSIFFEGSVNGLVVGSPVKIQGVPIGQVVAIRAIVDEPSPGQLQTFSETVIEIDQRRFDQTSRRDPEDVDPDDDDDTPAEVRAQLNLQSLLTGQLYVALSLDPKLEGFTGPARLAQHDQIPSIPNNLEVIEATARDFLTRVEALPLEDLIKNLDETIVAIGDVARDPKVGRAAEEVSLTLQEARSLLRNVNGKVDPLSDQALSALVELEATLVVAKENLEPGSPIVYQLGQTLQEVSQAAQAMRALANSLERQPNALVFGPAGGSD